MRDKFTRADDARYSKLQPKIDWLHTAQRLRRMGDRIGYRECLRISRWQRMRRPWRKWWSGRVP